MHTLYTPLAALIDKYSEPQTAKKRNGAMIAVPPMLPVLHPNASGKDPQLMQEIEVVKVFAAEWPLIPEKKKVPVGGFEQWRVEYRLATWQEFWGGFVNDSIFAESAPVIRSLTDPPYP